MGITDVVKQLIYITIVAATIFTCIIQITVGHSHVNPARFTCSLSLTGADGLVGHLSPP